MLLDRETLIPRETVISRARQILDVNHEVGHDNAHRIAVMNTCIRIVNEEQVEINMDALLIAAAWHDVLKGNENEADRILIEEMTQRKFGKNFINKVLAIKNSHTFGANPQILESQVLYAADKINYFLVDRLRQAVESGVPGKYLVAQKGIIRSRIPEVEEKLNSFGFRSAIKMYHNNKQQMADYVKDIPYLADLFD